MRFLACFSGGLLAQLLKKLTARPIFRNFLLAPRRRKLLAIVLSTRAFGFASTFASNRVFGRHVAVLAIVL